MHSEWTDRLSELLDDELPPETRADLLRHLEACEACAQVAKELRAVIARAGRLGERPPREDLWPAIAARIERTPLGPRVAGAIAAGGRRPGGDRVAWLRAASVALAIAAGGAVWWAVGGSLGSDPTVVADAPAATGAVAPVAIQAGEFGRTSAAIAELERTLAESRARLDPETVRVIEQNLALIDAAIEEVRRALAEDPGSTYLNLHMADTMRRKLQLLHDVGSLAARSL